MKNNGKKVKIKFTIYTYYATLEYHEEIELEQQELNEENQMLKLSVAEKETELLQSQDTLL